MRYYGKIGYETSVEIADSVWEPRILEMQKYGDVIRNTTRREQSDRINDEITLSNRISVVVKPDELSNFQTIKYVEWLGCRWNVKSMEINFPRVILEIGGAYTGEGPYVPPTPNQTEGGVDNGETQT